MNDIKKFNSVIKGTGSFLPDFVLDNFMLEKIMDTSDEWITTRTGIKQRNIEQNSATYEIIAKAGEKVIENSKIDRNEIDMIIVSSTSNDYYFPSLACLVQNKLNIPDAASFDISAACSGFVFAVDIADLYIKSGRKKKILVLGGDIMSRVTDYTDRSTSILFGDGSAGILLCAEEQEGENTYGVINSYTKTECDGEKPFYITSHLRKTVPLFDRETKEFLGNSDAIEKNNMQMNGRKVFEFAVNAMPKALESALKPTGYNVSDLSYIISHQANKKILDAIIRRYNFPEDRFPITIENTGNFSSSTIPRTLDILKNDGKLKDNDIIAFVGFGSGLTYGANIIKWKG